MALHVFICMCVCVGVIFFDFVSSAQYTAAFHIMLNNTEPSSSLTLCGTYVLIYELVMTWQKGKK